MINAFPSFPHTSNLFNSSSFAATHENGRHPGPPPAAVRRRRPGRGRLPRRPRLARLHRPMVRRDVRPRCGDRGAVRVPRRVGEPDQLPHGPAGGVHGGRGRGDQRLERRRHDAAAPRGVRRRRLAREVPDHRLRLHPLRREHGHADPVVGAPDVPHGRLQQLLRLAVARLLPVPGAGDHLLRVPLPGGAGGGRAQALRAGVRRRPVRPAPPKGVRRPELLLQLVVLRDVLRHRRHHRGLQLHPGQHRLGPRLRHPLPRHGPRPRHLPARHAQVPLLHLHAVQPLRPPRQSLRRARQGPQVGPVRGRGRRVQCRGAPGGGQRPAAAVPHLGDLHHLRRHLLPVLHLLHQAGRHAGPEDRRHVPGAARGAADVHQPDHHHLHPGLRPALRARRAAVHAPVIGHHNAAEDRDRPRPRDGGHGRGRAGRSKTARSGEGRRARGPAQGGAADEPVVDAAAVRAVRALRRVRHDWAAGVLLRPGPRRAAQHRPRLLPQHLRGGALLQQLPHLRHRQYHQEERRELVREQPQPRAPRLLLLAPCRPMRRGARRVRHRLARLCVQEEGISS